MVMRSRRAPGAGGRRLKLTSGRTASWTSVVKRYMLSLPARSGTVKTTWCTPGESHG